MLWYYNLVKTHGPEFMDNKNIHYITSMKFSSHEVIIITNIGLA